MNDKTKKIFNILAIILLITGIITVGIGTAYLFFNAIPAVVFHWAQIIYLTFWIGYHIATIIALKKSRK